MAVKEATPPKNIRQRLKQVPKETLAALYQSGQTLDEIGKTFGVTKQAVYKALKAYGAPRRGRSHASVLAFSKGKYSGKTTAELNESLFSQWSQPMAYLLGYIFTDGNLRHHTKTAFIVTISSIDRDHLEKLAAILGKGIPVNTQKQSKRRFSGSEDRYIHAIKFTRPRMIRDLRKLGLTERKSLTMKFPQVPDEFFQDFVRGCWDGDGSIFIGVSGYPTASFGTGSLSFITEMANKLRDRGFGKLTVHVKKPDRVKSKNPHYYLKIHSKRAVAFCEWLYENVPTHLMLTRKALVYQSWQSQRPDILFRCRFCHRRTLPGDLYCEVHRKTGPIPK